MAITVYTGPGDIGRATVSNGSSNTTIAINAPANVQNGRLLVLHGQSGDSLNPATIVLPVEWTPIRNNFNDTGQYTVHTVVAYKIWNTGDATTWNATLTSNTGDDDFFVTMYSGHDISNPIDVSSTAFTGTSSRSPTSPSITTITNGAVALFSCSFKNGNYMTTEDVGVIPNTTLIYAKRSRAFSNGICSALCYKEIPVAGATGIQTWTDFISANTYWTGYSLAIRPAAGPQTISSVNGGAGVRIGSTGNTAITVGFTTAPTSGTFGGKPITITGYNSGTGVVTFNGPVVVGGESFPSLNSTQTMILSVGAETASLPAVPLSPPVGRTAIIVASPENVDERAFGHILVSEGVTPVNGDEFYGIDADVTWTPSTYGSATSLPVVTPVVYRDTSTGIVYELLLTVNGEGVAEEPTITIPSNTLRAGQANAWTVSNFTPTSVSFAGLTITTFSNSSITLPGYANGAAYPAFGDQTLTATNGVDTVTMQLTLLPTANYTYTTLTDVATYSPGYIQGWTTCAINDQIVVNTPASLSVSDHGVNANGRIHTDRSTGSDLTIWHRRNSDGIMKQLTLKVD